MTTTTAVVCGTWHREHAESVPRVRRPLRGLLPRCASPLCAVRVVAPSAPPRPLSLSSYQGGQRPAPCTPPSGSARSHRLVSHRRCAGCRPPPLTADAIVCGGRRPPRLLPMHSAARRHLTDPSCPQFWWLSTTSPSAVDAAQTPSRICRLALRLRCISVFGPACPRPIASFPLAGYPSRRLGVARTSTVFRRSMFVSLHWTSC